MLENMNLAYLVEERTQLNYYAHGLYGIEVVFEKASICSGNKVGELRSLVQNINFENINWRYWVEKQSFRKSLSLCRSKRGEHWQVMFAPLNQKQQMKWEKKDDSRQRWWIICQRR